MTMQTNGKNGSINPRGDLSEREKEFIIMHAGKPGWSWGSIARALGKQFPEDNGGKRHRDGVRRFALKDPDRPVNVQVPIQASLIEAARKKGIDPGTVLARALEAEIHTNCKLDENDLKDVAEAKEDIRTGRVHTTEQVKKQLKKPSKKPTKNEKLGVSS